jgi:hypothetical protein
MGVDRMFTRPLLFFLKSVCFGSAVCICANGSCIAENAMDPGADLDVNPDMQKANVVDDAGAVYSNAQDYFDHVVKQKKPRVLIVGAGRAGGYAERIYGDRSSDYFLADMDSRVKPDRVCNVMTLDQLGPGFEGQFDRVVFEHLPIWAGLNRMSINGALKMLRPGGELYSSSAPRALSLGQYNALPLEDEEADELDGFDELEAAAQDDKLRKAKLASKLRAAAQTRIEIITDMQRMREPYLYRYERRYDLLHGGWVLLERNDFNIFDIIAPEGTCDSLYLLKIYGEEALNIFYKGQAEENDFRRQFGKAEFRCAKDLPETDGLERFKAAPYLDIMIITKKAS